MPISITPIVEAVSELEVDDRAKQQIYLSVLQAVPDADKESAQGVDDIFDQIAGQGESGDGSGGEVSIEPMEPAGMHLDKSLEVNP